MFSLLDAILDQPMLNLIGELNLSEPVRQALIGEESALSPSLNLSKAIENADWLEISRLAEVVGLSVHDVLTLHQDAIEWSVRSQPPETACV